MKKVSLFSSATVTSVLMATAIAVPAFAWHPVGTINKSVQDQTTNSAVADANDAASALIVNSGDTLVYTVRVSNTGAVASNGDNDMANTVLTDTLPAGVQLIGNAPATSLGTIKPGQSVTVRYTVKVTSTKDGDVITNQACFTGNSTVGDTPQSGCDTAVVKVHVPPTPVPTPTPTPAPQPQPTPTVLPDTGSTALSTSLFVAGAAAVAYAMNLLRLKLRSNA